MTMAALRDVPKDAVYGVYLEAPSTSGGKEWCGFVDKSNTMHAYWGKKDQMNQHAEKFGGFPELMNIQQKKLAKGYKEIDKWTQNIGWSSVQSNQPSVSAKGQTTGATMERPVTPVQPGKDIFEKREAPTDAVNWDF